MKILIENANIITMVNDEIIKGSILIKDDEICEVGNFNKELHNDIDEVIDAEGNVVMPGLINCHNHTPMSLLRAFCDDLKLMDWLDKKMLPAEDKMDADDVYYGAILAIGEMIKSGTTTFADMYAQLNSVAKATEETGIRASLSRGLVFFSDDGGVRMSEAMDLIENWTGKADGRITTMFGPHAPYTCPPEPLKKVVELAKKLDVPVHIHLAETEDETNKIREKYDFTPTEYLHNLGMLDGDLHVLLAHAIELTDNDISLLKNMKGGICHNPYSNLKLGSRIAPIKEYFENDVLVALGTDGAGSSTTLDMFLQMKLAGGLQKSRHTDPTLVNAEQILKMATINGAKLLNIDKSVGSLEKGKKADIIIVNINQLHMIPHHNIKSLIAYSASGADVLTTIINGKVLMRDRKLTTIDEKSLIKEVSKRVERIVEGI